MCNNSLDGRKQTQMKTLVDFVIEQIQKDVKSNTVEPLLEILDEVSDSTLENYLSDKKLREYRQYLDSIS